MKWTCFRGLMAVAVVVALRAQPPSQPRDAEWKQESVIYLDHSLNARLHPVPLSAVRIGDGFWGSRRSVTTERSLPSMLDLLEQHGFIDNFRRMSGRRNVPRKGPAYSDADVYKWIEAASWAIASGDTPGVDKLTLRTQIDSLTSDILAAQDPSGYLDTYYTGDKARLRLTDLTHSYEDYCLGHLIQAGIAYFRATGNRMLLDGGIRFANYVIDNFGSGKRPFVTSYPDLEMALVELYRTTGQSKYLDFTRYLLSGVDRDRLKLKDSDVRYLFSGKPFTSRTELEGHAARALYAASGATDYFIEAGDPAYKRTLDLLWTDLTMRKMYITGGVGSRASNETFGDAYDLSSQDSYAESCGAIANVMWNFRLLSLTGDARYADVLERALYNGANSAMSLSGTLYTYRNPLASNGEKLRNPWYDTACCPADIERLFESLSAYVYEMGRDGLYVNLYDNSELNWHLEDGTRLDVTQTTGYPWTGDIKLLINPQHDIDFAVHVRWPGWAPSATFAVNGQPVQTANAARGSFIPISRKWHRGDTIAITFGLPPVPMAANPRATDLYGHIAMQRGALVYALEQIDQSGAALGDIFVRVGGSSTTDSRKDLLGGVTVLKVAGQAAEKSLGDEPLYEPATVAFNRAKRPITLTFIPYYAFGNREPTPMEVWVSAALRETGAGAASAAKPDRRPEGKSDVK